MIATPYLLLVGDETDYRMAKTAAGVAYWCPDQCLGQLRFNTDAADLGLPELTVREAVSKGAKSILIGTSPVGGQLSELWRATLLEALEQGLDIANGLHTRIADIPALRDAAVSNDRQIHDVRHPTQDISVGTGIKRSGRRLLTVGTDCGVGKMYTALTIEKEMRSRGMKADFRASGQTGIFIVGQGIAVDCVVSDFVAGAAELLSPENDHDHWDVVEGQGSLYHAGFAGVSLGLLHGSQPDAVVLCHEAGREMIMGYEPFPVPSLEDCIELNLRLGSLTNPEIQCVGVAVNTSSLSDQEAKAYLERQQQQLNLPVVDPVRTGVAAIVDRLEKNYQ